MPRVSKSTKSNRGLDVSCDKCHKPIEVGQKYYSWKFRYGSKHTRHISCGAPKQSELTQSKMSGVYAAIEGATESIDVAACAADIAQALNDAASEIENVKDEYQSSLENMPEQLQSGDIGQQIQEKIDGLEEFQSELENAASEIEGEEEPTEPEEGQDLDETKEEWISGLRRRLWARCYQFVDLLQT